MEIFYYLFCFYFRLHGKKSASEKFFRVWNGKKT